MICRGLECCTWQPTQDHVKWERGRCSEDLMWLRESGNTPHAGRSSGCAARSGSRVLVRGPLANSKSNPSCCLASLNSSIGLKKRLRIHIWGLSPLIQRGSKNCFLLTKATINRNPSCSRYNKESTLSSVSDAEKGTYCLIMERTSNCI